ncbi:motility protein A [uncultured Gammaproteobacteria bacterium]
MAAVGWVVALISVLTGYVVPGGHLAILFQPFEVLIILGAAIGAFIVANPMRVVAGFGGAVGRLLKGPKYSKPHYLELLTALFQILKIAKTKGLLALEQHVEKPDESPLFQQFPKFASDHHAVAFLCDYLRLLSLGSDNPHDISDLFDQELEAHHAEELQMADAIGNLGDSMPALGIVAAVLGVIHTMGSISEPPEVLGHLIGGALVGTFMGILMSYGFVSPIASGLRAVISSEANYHNCMKAAILSHLHGYAPTISVEYARKVLQPHLQPTFQEVEEATAALPPA